MSAAELVQRTPQHLMRELVGHGDIVQRDFDVLHRRAAIGHRLSWPLVLVRRELQEGNRNCNCHNMGPRKNSASYPTGTRSSYMVTRCRLARPKFLSSKQVRLRQPALLYGTHSGVTYSRSLSTSRWLGLSLNLSPPPALIGCHLGISGVTHSGTASTRGMHMGPRTPAKAKT